MAVASDFLIGANDEHGLNPPTAGKRTPVLPYIGRSFYENEFNRLAKFEFILACLRCGFNVYDVHPEVQDISVSSRVVRARRANVSILVTFAYNASGNGTTFNSARGLEVYYSPFNPFPNESRLLSEQVFSSIIEFSGVTPRFVGRLSVGVLSNVNCPSTLIEAGFMTNFEEAKLMLNPIFVSNVGEGACNGVCQYLGVPYVARELNNYPTIRQNSSGNFVTILQYLLNQYGYDLDIDGKFGTNTLRAVQDFQTKNKLVADGIVGKNTWSALLNINPSSFTLRRGDRSSGVLFLQRLLLSYLYPITNLDGIFGPETERAVRAFQTENGLSNDGIVGRNTWTSLFNSVGRPNPN
ncbi:MAG: peptidoglycan-binding protein [Clostridia bacterium]|nr:peptidoglycan-binding protein [Clostridia bacterium]